MTIFYPLLADIADEKTKEKLKTILLDPEQFWGDNVIPTVSRDAPSYCDDVHHRGNYWRGNIWAPTTYITYLAIKEVGWDDIAYQYAQKAHTQFMEYWEKYCHAYENYPAFGRVDPNKPEFEFPFFGGREVRYPWAGAMVQCGLEEIFAPEVLRKGIRFGNPNLSQQSSWKKFSFGNQQIEASAGPELTHVKYGDLWEFQARLGVIVRGFITDNKEVIFTVISSKSVLIRFYGKNVQEARKILVNSKAMAVKKQGKFIEFDLSSGNNELRIQRKTSV